MSLFLFCGNAHAQNLDILKLTFKPKEAVVVTNTLAKALTATCEIHAVSDRVNSVSIVVTNGSGSFNGTSLKKGQTLTQKVYNLQNIAITATSGTQAQITNLGEFDIKARCG